MSETMDANGTRTGEMNLINLSGGKDSTAMLLLALERGVENLRIIFCDTGNEHPLTYEYIEYLRGRLGLPIETLKADVTERLATRRRNLAARWASEGIPQERIDKAIAAMEPTGNPFLDLALWSGCFPSMRRRFCTKELKVEVVKKQVYEPALASGVDIVSWQGLRRDESAARACAKEREFVMSDAKTGAEVWAYRPILDWKAEDCFAMLRKHGVDPNPLYKLGMRRVGCMPCILSGKQEIKEIARRFPDQIDRIERWEKLVSDASHRGAASFFPWRAGATNIREKVLWANTGRGGKQLDLIEEDLPACSSQYGLCE